MRLLLGVTMIFAVAAFGSVGCGKGKSTTAPPKPGTTTPTPPVGDKGSIEVEKIDDVTIKKDESTDVVVKIARTKFKGEVKLEVEVGPKAKGVTAKAAKVEEGKDSVKITLKADKDASGSDEVTVTATGEGVKDASKTFKVTVGGAAPPPPPVEKGSVKTKKIDDVEIEKKKTAKVMITLDRTKFAEDVMIKIDDSKLPEGVTVKDKLAKEFGTKGKDEGTIILQAAEDAKGSGSLTITISHKDIEDHKQMIKVSVK